MGASGSKDADDRTGETEGIVTVTSGTPAAAPGVAAPQITHPQALETLASLAELRKLVPEPAQEQGGTREFMLLAAISAGSSQLSEELGAMIQDHQAWAHGQTQELVQAQRSIHSQVDQAEQKAVAALQHVTRAAASIQATERQLLQLDSLSHDLSSLVASAQEQQQRLRSLRTRWQQQQALKRARGTSRDGSAAGAAYDPGSVIDLAAAPDAGAARPEGL